MKLVRVKFNTAYAVDLCLIGNLRYKVVESTLYVHSVLDVEVPDDNHEFLNEHAINIEILKIEEITELRLGGVYKCDADYYYKCVTDGETLKLLRYDGALFDPKQKSIVPYSLEEFIIDHCPYAKGCNSVQLFSRVKPEHLKILGLFL